MGFGLKHNAVISGNAPGCQEAEGRQGPGEGLGNGPVDPGHQAMQAGRLSSFWTKGPGIKTYFDFHIVEFMDLL